MRLTTVSYDHRQRRYVARHFVPLRWLRESGRGKILYEWKKTFVVSFLVVAFFLFVKIVFGMAENGEVTFGEALKSSSSRKSKPAADSVAKMLAQAVRSQDNQLLEEALTSRSVAKNTVAKLPTNLVVPFLMELVKRVRAKPSRVQDLIPWIRSTLLIHMAYLASVPNIAETLGGLYELMEARQGTAEQLHRLQGRLDLMLSHMGMQDEVPDSEPEEDDLHMDGPATFFEEDE